jgi:thymidylate synthase (FAD)
MTEFEFVTKASATLVQSNATDDMVAMAAWVSFDRDSEERLNDKDRMKGLINFLMREKHMSPFEHGSFTFKIDCPLYVAREFHRHRTMAYNEVSGRYTKMNYRFMTISDERTLVQKGKAGKYTFVSGTKEQQDAVKESDRRVAKFLIAEYEKLLDIGIAKEVARTRLPMSLMTQFYATVNPRNLMHFLGLRTSPQALYEIREVAEDMEKALAAQMPMTYDAWKPKSTVEAGEVVGHMGTGKSTGPHLRLELNVNEGIMTRNEVQRSFDRGRE